MGWPNEVAFKSPYKLSTVDDVRALFNALKDGTCTFIKLSKRDHDAFKDQLRSRRQAGESVGKPRKERSDKGHSRGKRSALNGEDANGRPLKRARTSRTAPKSSEFINTSDDDDGDGDNDRENDDE